jgi:signal transduction histidine kinase
MQDYAAGCGDLQRTVEERFGGGVFPGQDEVFPIAVMRRALVFRCLVLSLLLAAGGCAPPDGKGEGMLADYLSGEVRELDQRIGALRRDLEPLPDLFPTQQTARIGYVSRPTDANAPRNPDRPDTRSIRLDLGSRQPIDTVVLVPAEFSSGPGTGAGYGFPIRWRVEVSDVPGFEEELRVLADYTGANFPNPRRFPVVIHAPEGLQTRYVRLTATELWTSEGRSLLALGEIMVLQGGRNLAAGLRGESIRPGGDDADEVPPFWSRGYLMDGQSVIGLPQGIEESPTGGWQSLPEASQDAPSWVMVDLGREVPLHEIRLVPAFSGDYPARRGFGFPPRLKIEIAPESDTAFAQPTKVDDYTGINFFNPRENPVSFRVPGTPARYVKITATRRSERLDDYVFALSELQVFSGGENVAAGASVSAQSSLENERWSTRFLTDGYSSRRNLLPWREYVTGLQQRREMEREIGKLTATRATLTESTMRSAIRWALWGLALAAAAVLYILWRGRRSRRRELARLRRRLAQDIHDEIGSGLGTISLLSQMGSGHEQHPAETREEFAEINRLSTTVTESLRDIVWFIRPETRTVGDLAQRLRETAASMLGGIEHTFLANGPALERDLPLDHKRQVLLFFKEALHNIQRHSRTCRAEVAVTGDERCFRLKVQDFGCGFDAAAPASGAGVTGMQQRAQTLGGRLIIESAPGLGTTLLLEVPWRAVRKRVARTSGT